MKCYPPLLKKYAQCKSTLVFGGCLFRRFGLSQVFFRNGSFGEKHTGRGRAAAIRIAHETEHKSIMEAHAYTNTNCLSAMASLTFFFFFTKVTDVALPECLPSNLIQECLNHQR